MKLNTFKNSLKIYNYFTTGNHFKFLFVCGLLLCIYAGGVLGISSENFLDSLVIPMQIPYFNTILFLMYFINGMFVSNIYNKNFDYFIIRYQKKETFKKKMIQTINILNIYYSIIFIILYFSLMLLFNYNGIKVIILDKYHITNLIYIVFFIVRYFVFINIYASLFNLIYLNKNRHLTIIILTAYILGFFFLDFLDVNNTFTLNPWIYVFKENYRSFNLEVFSSIFNFALLLIFYIIIYKFIIKKNEGD